MRSYFAQLKSCEKKEKIFSNLIKHVDVHIATYDSQIRNLWVPVIEDEIRKDKLDLYK